MPKSSHIFAFSLGAGTTILLMLFMGYQLDGDMGFCKLTATGTLAETPATCAREWIGALSGWVAAVGAIAIGLPTLQFLKDQVKLTAMESELALNFEAQRQIHLLMSWIRERLKTDVIDMKKIEDIGDFSVVVHKQVNATLVNVPASIGNRIKARLPLTSSLTDAIRKVGNGDLEATLDEEQVVQVAEAFLRDLLMRLWDLEGELNRESQSLADWKHNRLIT